MTNTIFSDIKNKVDQLLIHLAVTTKDFSEPLLDAITEIKRQYYISTLKDLTKDYPETALKTNSLLYFLDHENYNLEDMQFGAVPDSLYDAIKAIKNPEKDCPDFVEPPESFDNDGLNEPDYPYDTEPSA